MHIGPAAGPAIQPAPSSHLSRTSHSFIRVLSSLCVCTRRCEQEADYRLDGRVEIICAALDGEVRGYLPTDASEGATPETLRSLDDVARGLEEKKQVLLTELRNYEAGE